MTHRTFDLDLVTGPLKRTTRRENKIREERRGRKKQKKEININKSNKERSCLYILSSPNAVSVNFTVQLTGNGSACSARNPPNK
jgi:hypothetical protein